MKTTEQIVRLSSVQKPMDQIRREIRQQKQRAERYARAWERRNRQSPQLRTQ